MKLTINQGTCDDSKTESGGEPSDVRIGWRDKVCWNDVARTCGHKACTYLILGEFKIGLNGFRDKREPRQTVLIDDSVVRTHVRKL
jgi:hypothetical protein